MVAVKNIFVISALAASILAAQLSLTERSNSAPTLLDGLGLGALPALGSLDPLGSLLSGLLNLGSGGASAGASSIIGDLTNLVTNTVNAIVPGQLSSGLLNLLTQTTTILDALVFSIPVLGPLLSPLLTAVVALLGVISLELSLSQLSSITNSLGNIDLNTNNYDFVNSQLQQASTILTQAAHSQSN